MNHLKFYLLLVFTFLCFGVIVPANAQTIPQNLSGVSVSDLSESQLRQLMQQAQASGLSDEQLLQTLQSRGLSADQSKILQTRVTALRKTASPAVDAPQDLPVSRELNYKAVADTISGKESVTSIFTPKVYGANLFKNSNTTFEPNLKLATPVNYIVGPDDQLNINVYGASLVSWKLNVSPEGNINIPGIGSVYC